MDEIKLKKKLFTESEIQALLKGIECGDFEDEFAMPQLDEFVPKLRSDLLESHLNKLLIRFLHPDVQIKEIKLISMDIYNLINASWNRFN